MLGSSMLGGLCVYLTFELFRIAGIEMRPDGKDTALANWKSLILLASIASVFNSEGKRFFFESLSPLAEERRNVLGRRYGWKICVFAVTERYRKTLKALVEHSSYLETRSPFFN